jgi:hypothetical protein
MIFNVCLELFQVHVTTGVGKCRDQPY